MIDLFSGIGGISLAGRWVGIETIAFCEIEPFCQKVLKKHWPDIPIISDIRDVNKNSLIKLGVDHEQLDIICGGFPCQPFSKAGKQRSKDDDRYLWPEMFRIVQELKPTWVIGENVTGIINLALDDVLFDLENAGYETQSFSISACAVNATHKRERVFMVAHSNGRRCGEKRLPSLGRKMGEWRKSANLPSKIENPSINEGVSQETNWDIEPNMGRVANGIPSQVDRLKCLGNAVVPQQIYPILKVIKEIHESVTQL